MALYSDSERESILNQAQKILKSQDFARSGRLSQFLTYIVDKTLSGDLQKLKGYTIGIEVFGKPQDFDPDTDASVRVEATRLRKALSLYYAHEGQNDPVVIQIPKGSYKPLFLFEKPSKISNPDLLIIPEAANDAEPARRKPSHPIRLLVLIGGTLLALAASFMLWPGHRNSMVGTDVTPVIAISPVHMLGDESMAATAQEFPTRLVKNLSRFYSVKVFDGSSWVSQDDTQSERLASLKKTGANYILEAEIQGFSDHMNVNARLLDTKKTTYVWSMDRDYSLEEINKPDFINEVTGTIASQLASPYGVVYNLEQERVDELTGPAAETYRCIMDYYAYCNNKTPQGHALVRQCLEKAVERDPNNSEAWAYLSWIYGNEIRYRHNPIGTEEEARQRSLSAAEKALHIDPTSARAHQYMAIATLFNGDEKLGRKHKLMSVELNPFDSEILADTGWFYGQVGEWEKSRFYAEKAINMNPGHARWYYGVLFMYHYQAGDYEQALGYALKYAPTDDVFSDVAVAASYAGLNRTKEARQMAEKVQKKYPNFVKDPYGSLSLLGFTKKDTDKLLLGVEAAGVPVRISQEP